MGGAPSVPTPKAPDTGQEFQGALQAYTQGAPALYQEEAQYQPMYNQLQQGMAISNIPAYTGAYSGAMLNNMQGLQQGINFANVNAQQQGLSTYANAAGTINQYALNANPGLQALQNYGLANLGATADPTMQGLLGQVQQQLPGQVQQLQDLAGRAGGMYNAQNQQLQGLSDVAGGLTAQGVGDIRGIAGQAAANTRPGLWTQTGQQIGSQLGQLDPLTGQLNQMAQQQLALGSSASPQQILDAQQQARAAFSARGMAGSSGAIAGEVLNRFDLGQQLLQQRQQFGTGVSQLTQGELQQQMANALGWGQADIGATQANQQLAGQLYQGAAGLGQQGAQLQAGLQGQIASNIGNAMQQQAGLSQAAIGTQQAGMQQAAGLQGSILDQMFRQQQAGAGALGNVYGALAGVQQGILGQQATAPQYAAGFTGQTPQYDTGGPDLFQSSGLLNLMSQNQMAQMNATSQANMVNAQSKGAASGAMLSAGAGIAGALAVGAVAL